MEAAQHPGRLRTVAKVAAAITLAFAAFMVVVHTKGGRKLLAPFYAAKCPVGEVSPADIERARSESARANAGANPAPARPALGFHLEKTSPADVHAWAQKHGVACKDERQGALIRCTSIPPAALEPAHDGAPLSEMLFAFEPKGMKLVNMTAYIKNAPDTVVAARGRAMQQHLTKTLGPAETESGTFDAAYLSSGDGIQLAMTSHRFRDYHATVTATRLRPGHVMLREHYMAGAPDEPSIK